MKTMNKTFRALSILVVSAIGISSCNDLLDLTPNEQIRTEQAFESEQHLQAALAGTYDRLSSVNLLGGYAGIFSDLLGRDGDIGFQGTFADLRNAFNRSLDANGNLVAVPWTSGYGTINAANEVIANAPTVLADNAPRANRYVAEARFIRGIVMFELVRLYAKAYNDGDPSVNPGIPLVLSPSRSQGDSLVHRRPRASVQQVYDQVLADLKFAAANMTVASLITGSQDGGREFGNARTANAYLARVYLAMSAAAAPREAGAAIDAASLAAQYATSVINAAGATPSLALVDRYSDLWTTGRLGSEDIFGLTVSNQDGTNQFSTFYSGLARRDITITSTWLNRYEATTDVRRQQNVMWWNYRNRNHSKKWDDIVNGDVKLYRYAEVFLNRAEALMRKATISAADSAQAIADIDRIRTRAGRPTYATQFPGQPLTLDAIRLERLRELCFEGHFLHDVKRFQRANIGTAANPIPWNSNRLVMPIPIRELEVNPYLVQNPGYGS